MMCQSKRFIHVCGVALLLLVAAVGCRHRDSAPQNEGASAEAEHKSEGAPAEEHHDDAPGAVELSAEAMDRAGIRLETVKASTSGHVLMAPAELQPDADRLAHVGPRVAGRIARVLVPIGATVRAGQALATIRSPEAAEAAAALDSARAAENLARRTLGRERELFERKVSAQREVLEAEAAHASAEAAVRAARARLAAMGFSSGTDSQRTDPVVTVTSPIAGTVIERTAAADAPVGPRQCPVHDCRPPLTVARGPRARDQCGGNSPRTTRECGHRSDARTARRRARRLPRTHRSARNPYGGCARAGSQQARRVATRDVGQCPVRSSEPGRTRRNRTAGARSSYRGSGAQSSERRLRAGRGPPVQGATRHLGLELRQRSRNRLGHQRRRSHRRARRIHLEGAGNARGRCGPS